jgi:Carboxypeptidase regulatory-like domain
MRLKILFAIVLSLCAVSAYAQFKASIQGTVIDPQGSAVAGAKVTVTNQATGVTRDTVAGDTGFYRISELPPGSYAVTVEATGFKQSVSKDIAVEAEQPRGFDVTLTVGNVSESVTVTASAGGLETENASVNTTIGSQEVLTLPQFGRDPYELLHLAPGVFGDNARQGNGNAFALPQQVGPGQSNNSIF